MSFVFRKFWVRLSSPSDDVYSVAVRCNWSTPYSSRITLTVSCIRQCYMRLYSASILRRTMFLGAYALTRKSQNTLVMSIPCLPACLSVCPHVTARLPLHEFPWNLILGTFIKICLRKSRFGKNRTKISTTLHEDLNRFSSTSDITRHKIALFECYGIRLLGLTKRYKQYANASQFCLQIVKREISLATPGKHTGSGSEATLILNLGIRCISVVSFTVRPLYAQERNPENH